MKKLIFICATIFALTACSQPVPHPDFSDSVTTRGSLIPKDLSALNDLYKASSYSQEKDAGSLEWIETPSNEIQFARDNHHIYKFFLNEIKATPYDMATFRIYPTDATIVFDKAGVYISDTLIPDLDPETFQIVGPIPNIGNANFIKDKNHFRKTCCDFEIMPQIDAPTANLIGGYFIKDKNALYDMWGSRMDHLDKDTFNSFLDKDQIKRGLVTPYYKDKNGVYFLDKKIEKAKLKTFQPIFPKGISQHSAFISSEFAKDKKSVYCNGRPVPGLDPATFEMRPVDWYTPCPYDGSGREITTY